MNPSRSEMEKARRQALLRRSETLLAKPDLPPEIRQNQERVRDNLKALLSRGQPQATSLSSPAQSESTPPQV